MQMFVQRYVKLYQPIHSHRARLVRDKLHSFSLFEILQEQGSCPQAELWVQTALGRKCTYKNIEKSIRNLFCSQNPKSKCLFVLENIKIIWVLNVTVNLLLL